MSISREERDDLRELVKDAELHAVDQHVTNETLRGLLDALDEADSEKAGLQQENERLQYELERERHRVEGEFE